MLWCVVNEFFENIAGKGIEYMGSSFLEKEKP